MKNLLLTVGALLLAGEAMYAKVKMPHLIGDNMVIQQQSDVRLWGWDKAGETVTVKTSWSNDVVKAKTGKDGKWQLTVKSPVASYTPLSISFSDSDGTVTVSDVLAGEVWVCAGQSNMEMPVKGFSGCPVLDMNNEILDAANSKGVRSVKLPSVMSMTPLDDAQCEWRKCCPATVGDFSATGYFFARLVSRTLDIPVGLIEANKGGTRVESWLDEANLKAYTKEEISDSAKIAKNFAWDYLRPLVWGNGTFHPILNYTVKGILFYQGCSNVGDPGNQYSERLKLLVEQWRRDFRLGELPFYFVEIAPYAYGDGVDGVSGAMLREQQYRASQIIPNSAIVSTNDAAYPYEVHQIHPAQKQKVGERLAFVALNKTYGMKYIICDSPVYKDMIVQDGIAYLGFDNLADGYNRQQDIEGFEIAGEDKVFHKATATKFWIPGNDARNERIAVSSPEVKNPVAVRYCFKNFQIGNLANHGGLPLIPFRTDM